MGFGYSSTCGTLKFVFLFIVESGYYENL
jgi:hypothetical protein